MQQTTGHGLTLIISLNKGGRLVGWLSFGLPWCVNFGFCECVCVCVCACVRACVRACVCVCMHAWVHGCAHVCVSMCVLYFVFSFFSCCFVRGGVGETFPHSGLHSVHAPLLFGLLFNGTCTQFLSTTTNNNNNRYFYTALKAKHYAKHALSAHSLHQTIV